MDGTWKLRNYDSCPYTARNGHGLNHLQFFLKTTHSKTPKKSSLPRVLHCKTSYQYLDGCFFRLFQQKPPTHKRFFACLGTKISPKFVRYFEILIVVAVQSNSLLFALFWKISKSAYPITLLVIFHSDWSGNRSVPQRKFCPV